MIRARECSADVVGQTRLFAPGRCRVGVGRFFLGVGIVMWRNQLGIYGLSTCSSVTVEIGTDSAVYTEQSAKLNNKPYFSEIGGGSSLYFTQTSVAESEGCDGDGSIFSSSSNYYWHLGVPGEFGYLVGDCAEHPADISSSANWELFSEDGVLITTGVTSPTITCNEDAESGPPSPAPSVIERDATGNSADEGEDDEENEKKDGDGPIYGGLSIAAWSGVVGAVAGVCACCVCAVT